MEIVYSEKSLKQLKNISKTDLKSARMILEKIEKYAINPFGSYDIKVLKGKLATFKRMRAGDYRIIFDDERDIMHIYEIKHRKKAYV